MSSRSKKPKRTSAPAPHSSTYPTEWSQWAWIPDLARFQRFRLVGPNNYEYEDQQAQSTTEPRTWPSVSLDAIAESSGQYASPPKNFHLSPSPPSVSHLTQAFGATSLGTSQSQKPPPISVAQIDERQHIRTRDASTTQEELNGNYKVHSAWEFKFGRVFKVLWTEPKGEAFNQGGSNGSESEHTIRVGKHGEKHYEKIRRFVIVNPMEGHCICLPILTYSGRGVNKKGVKAGHHTIIYTSSSPKAYAGELEKGMVKAPLKVKPMNSRHKLDPASRLNYAKTYTVEYNVKVWFTGEVVLESHWHLSTDFRETMQIPIRGLQPVGPIAPTSTQPPGGTYNSFLDRSTNPSTTSSFSRTTTALSGMNTGNYAASGSFSRALGLRGSRWNSPSSWNRGIDEASDDPLAGTCQRYPEPSGHDDNQYPEHGTDLGLPVELEAPTSTEYDQGSYSQEYVQDPIEEVGGEYHHDPYPEGEVQQQPKAEVEYEHNTDGTGPQEEGNHPYHRQYSAADYDPEELYKAD